MVTSPEQPRKYQVDRLPSVTAQIQRLAAKAKLLGIAQQILDVLVTIIDRLETSPLEWGDPEYATKHPGGLVLHGLHFPLIVHYATSEQERVVCILDIGVFPGHPLEGA